MKLYCCLFAAAFSFLACSSGVDEGGEQPQPGETQTSHYQENLFPQDDGAAALSATPAQAVWQILSKFNPNMALGMGETSITDSQLAEIKDFVNQSLKADNDYDTYRNIFEWISKNMTYASDGEAYLAPYEVFTKKRCICQGYANLLKTMCLTQGIPCCNANGWLSTIGGHAWNYVYAGGRWLVSDPTNHAQYEAGNVTSYQNTLIPQRLDVTLFEDDAFAYNFQDGQLNVQTVKSSANAYVVIPWSTNGLRISSFHPTSALPSNVTQLYVGSNIDSFGSEPSSLSSFTEHLTEAFIDPKSTNLSSYKNVIYKDKVSLLPYYIPTAIKSLELRAMSTVDKNVVTNLPCLEEIYIPEGTQRIEAYAVENCPKLKTAYVPESVTYIDSNAFYRCGDVKIVRTKAKISL